MIPQCPWKDDGHHKQNGVKVANGVAIFVNNDNSLLAVCECPEIRDGVYRYDAWKSYVLVEEVVNNVDDALVPLLYEDNILFGDIYSLSIRTGSPYLKYVVIGSDGEDWCVYDQKTMVMSGVIKDPVYVENTVRTILEHVKTKMFCMFSDCVYIQDNGWLVKIQYSETPASYPKIKTILDNINEVGDVEPVFVTTPETWLKTSQNFRKYVKHDIGNGTKMTDIFVANDDNKCIDIKKPAMIVSDTLMSVAPLCKKQKIQWYGHRFGGGFLYYARPDGLLVVLSGIKP